MTGTEVGGLRGATRRGTYGVLVGVGAIMLAVGLLVPFLVADPVTDQGLGAGPSGGLGPVPGAGGGSSLDTDDTVLDGTADGATTTTVPGPGGVDGGGPLTTAPDGSPTEPRTASDVGITADVVTVGVPVPDLSAMGDTEGGVKFAESFGDMRAQYQTAIDALNQRGGINGRQVRAEYRSYKAADLDAMRAACIYLTEERKVFAVLGGFYGDPILCVTEQHRTPMVAMASEPDDFYARSQGNFFSIAASKDRILGDLATALHRDGAMKGRTVGILDQEGIDAIPVDRTLIPRLEALGYDVAYHARIANDIGAAQSQIPIEVQRMRGAGVDTVIVASGLVRATVFAQEAQNQRWRPQYLLSDFASGATDVFTAAMPASFEGAVAYTSFRTGEARAGLPEAAHDRACREQYEAATGDRLDRKAIEYYYAVTACGIVDLFARGLAGAGTNPTRASFSQGLQRLGPIDVPYGAAGSFGAGKYDAPDSTRRVAWKPDCKCWLPADGFRSTR